jgi:hypothetical protein
MVRLNRCIRHPHGRQNRFISLSSLILIGFLFSIFLAACSGGGSGDTASGTASSSGQVVVGITDVQGDFTAYWVDVVALTLTRQDGANVEVLPLKTRIDFSQYVELTEFVTASTIPSGKYTKASLLLDYQNADIRVEDAVGNAVKVENILDENGSPISTLTVSVHLEDRNSLIIAPGIPAFLTLDFDLKASNQVTFNGSNMPTVTVQPLLLADVNPEEPKVHRLRGPLKAVDVGAGTFDIIIRPFIHVLTGADEQFGVFKVITDGATIFDINGNLYEGQDGLQALNQQQTLTAVIVVGDLKPGLHRFEARQVYAGTSVPGGSLDVVTGTVMRREANQLTVKGATLIRSNGIIVPNDTVQILLGPDTPVSRQLSTAPFGIEDISVGQHITVFGSLNSEETELDAGEGYVRMHLTTLKGEIARVDSSLYVALSAINGRDAGLFDFGGTGADSGNDADPAEYDVDTGALDVSGLTAGKPIKCRGFVTSFGHAANSADFEAVAVVDVSNVKGLMVVNWSPSSTDAFETITANGLTINFAGVGDFHKLNRAGVITDLKQLSKQPEVKPQSLGSGLFVIHHGSSSQLFFTFRGFSDELSQRFNENASVKLMGARGQFDDITGTLTANWVFVMLESN